MNKLTKYPPLYKCTTLAACGQDKKRKKQLASTRSLLLRQPTRATATTPVTMLRLKQQSPNRMLKMAKLHLDN